MPKLPHAHLGKIMGGVMSGERRAYDDLYNNAHELDKDQRDHVAETLIQLLQFNESKDPALYVLKHPNFKSTLTSVKLWFKLSEATSHASGEFKGELEELLKDLKEDGNTPKK